MHLLNAALLDIYNLRKVSFEEFLMPKIALSVALYQGPKGLPCLAIKGERMHNELLWLYN